ncbi:hypothetical protein ACFVU2_19800 [Leifsonia sp. NPDC058194]|uniref:hypothetical protein n=1 Tax=Leifsonia sp. NPDC058194 TaxID=3346374 RepID=UPI0036D903C1
MPTTIVRTLAAVAIAASAVTLTSGCTALVDVMRGGADSAAAGTKSTPAPPGSPANPYGATNDPYGHGYIGEWVALPDGKHVLCVRRGGSENGSDPISCDFEHEIDPTAPTK